MGEIQCIGLLKFNHSDLTTIADDLKQFINEGLAAYDFWQYSNELVENEWWEEFRKRFPAIFDYIKGATFLTGNDKKYLARVLAFPTEISIIGNTIKLSGTIWDGATWEILMNYLYFRYLAKDYVWYTDADPIDEIHWRSEQAVVNII